MTASPTCPIHRAIFLGRLNKIYGMAGKVDPQRIYHGNYGFILD